MEVSVDRLPVVFVHGIRISGTAWRPVADLVGAFRPVAAPDLPGHGSRRGEPFTLDASVAAVANAIDDIGGAALLVGHSLGGYVGVATAGRHPDRVAGLVAIGCTRLPHGAFAAGFRMVARLAGAYPHVGDRLSARVFRRALPASVAEATLAGGLACEVMPQVVDAITGLDPLTWLRGYPGQVWLVNGERDPFRANEELFLRACHDGHLTVLPGRGHISCLAEPTVLADIVTSSADAIRWHGDVRVPDSRAQ
jgi:pimeloyl-ACP methyl ester carboxylesterase